MSDLNRCEFIGHLGADPDVRYTQDGKAVANFSIAVTEKWKKDGQKQEKTEWVRIVAWSRLGEICGEYLKKGSQVFIAGKFTTEKWQDKDGNDRYTTKVVANDMQMLGSRDASENQKQSSLSQPDGSFQAPDDFDDIPFS